MTKEVKVSVVLPEQFNDPEGFKAPAKFYIVDCLGQRVYIHIRDRAKCQEFVDSEYGKGKYKVRTDANEKGSGNITARGSVNNRSRAGTNLVNIRNGQGRGL